jgi:hypothetical protein
VKSTRKTSAILAVTTALTLVLATSASAEERPRDGTWRDHNATTRDGSRRNDGTRNESRNNNSYRNESRNNNFRNETRRDNNFRNETRRDSTFRNESRRDSGFRGESRRDDHINMRGRITRFSHERDGYRVWLDRDNRSFWIPESRLGRHRLSVGLELRLGGIFNGGYIAVDALGWPGDPYYNDPYYGGGYYGGGYYNNAYASGYLSGRVERVDPRYGTLLLRDDRSGRVVEVDMRAADRGRADLDDLRPGDRVTLDGSWDGRFFHAYRIDGVRPY